MAIAAVVMPQETGMNHADLELKIGLYDSHRGSPRRGTYHTTLGLRAPVRDNFNWSKSPRIDLGRTSNT